MKLKSNGINHNVKGIPLVVTYHPLLKSLRAIIDSNTDKDKTEDVKRVLIPRSIVVTPLPTALRS